MTGSELLYTVHVVRPYGCDPLEMIWAGEPAARSRAAQLSRQPGVLAAVITEYVMEGVEWTPFEMYTNGTRRQVPPSAFPHGAGAAEGAGVDKFARRRAGGLRRTGCP